jgi:pimeloyl-ACP methyl ester carboxylesterase
LCKVGNLQQNYRMTRNNFILFNGSKLHYAVAGQGAKKLLIFHGFGQDHRVFEYLTQSLARHYTFYLFDLYFHGTSEWAHGETVLSKQEWKDSLSKFLTENNINRFSVGAFSMGGKFALTALEFFPNRIEALTLIAPDGIKTSFWYSLATYPVLFRRFFRSMIMSPNRFIKFAESLNRAGWVDKGLIRFAEYQMGTEEKRKRVYYSWVVFRKLKPDLKLIADIINKNSITLTFIVGKYDKVIAPEKMKSFLKTIKKYRLEILDSGHHGLIDRSIQFFLD